MRPIDPNGQLYRRLAERAVAAEVRAELERLAAPGRYEELMRLAPRERAATVERDGRFATFALADLLLDLSREVRTADPEAGRDLVRLAQAVTVRLDAGRYGTSLLADLEGRAWAYLGDAQTETDPASARDAFERAEACLARGSGDPLAEAEVVCLSAGVLDDPPALGTAASTLSRRVH